MPHDLIELGRSIIEERQKAGRYKGVSTDVLEQMADDVAERLDNITAALIMEEVDRAGKTEEFEKVLMADGDPTPLLQTIPGWEQKEQALPKQAYQQVLSEV